MSEAPKKRWYVVQAFSGFEGRVATSLREHIKLHNMEDLFGEVICLFFAGVVFGLSSVYVQGGNRISTMFSALAVRNIMLGVPSGCFTGSFWYGGIQCTVFHFLQTFLLSGHTLPYLPE